MIRRYTDLAPHSSSLELAGYDPESRTLRLVFKRKQGPQSDRWPFARHYEYHAIPAELYCALLNAPSIGKFFNRHIRPIYVGHLVKGKK